MHSIIYPAMISDGFLHWLQSIGSVLIGAVIGFITGYVSDILKTGRGEKRKRQRMRKALYIEIAQLYGTFKPALKGFTAISTKVSKVQKRLESATQRLKDEMAVRDQLCAELNIQKASGENPERIKELEAQVAKSAALIAERKPQISEIKNEFESAIASAKRKVGEIFKIVGTDSYKYARSNPETYYELPEAWAIDEIYIQINLIIGSVEADEIDDTVASIRSFMDSVVVSIKSGHFDRNILKDAANVLLKEIETEENDATIKDIGGMAASKN